MNARLCLALPLALAAAALAAETLAVERLAFVPARFSVGEEVEAVALLAEPRRELEPFVLKEGEGLPPPSPAADPELREIRLAKAGGGWELRVRFVSWKPGKAEIPTLSARGVVLPALSYETASVLGPGDREPSPPKPQRDPPGAALYLYGFAGLFLVIVLGGIGSALYLVPAARRIIAKSRAAQASRALDRSLAYLEKGIGSVAARDFYAALARSLRLYLAARVLPEAPALTPAEIAALPESRFPCPGLREDAAAVLAESDRARFAGFEPGSEAMRAALASAQRLGAAAEEALDAIV
ncbi:MAG: hypothetical protein JNG85_04735 [Spirochaetaceae bacterium]|nr:hypothetical protein [Spirochaetaceae bacterium]